MSKRSARTRVEPGLVTRKQQVRAVRDIKTQEVAKAVAGRIEEAVKSEVAAQLGVIKDTMLNLIDRVVELESNSDDRQEGAEAVEVPEDDQVASESSLEGSGVDSQDYP